MISDVWPAGDGIGKIPGVAALGRAIPPCTAICQFRNIDGEMPTSLATCINGRPLLSSRATASRLNSAENPRLVLVIQHSHALTGLAKVSTEARHHHPEVSTYCGHLKPRDQRVARRRTADSLPTRYRAGDQ